MASKFLKGITVELINQVDSGTKDRFNRPIYTEKSIQVANVLVSPSSSNDVTDDTVLSTDQTTYQLAIPKGDRNIWKNGKVKFFGKTWSVVGDVIEGIEDLIPLDWNRKVTVELYE